MGSYGYTGHERLSKDGLVTQINQTQLQLDLARGPSRTKDDYNEHGLYGSFYERRNRLREGRGRIKTIGSYQGRGGHGWSGNSKNKHLDRTNRVFSFGSSDAINRHFDAKLLEFEAKLMAEETQVEGYENAVLPLHHQADSENIELQADEIRLKCDDFYASNTDGKQDEEHDEPLPSSKEVRERVLSKGHDPFDPANYPPHEAQLRIGASVKVVGKAPDGAVSSTNRIDGSYTLNVGGRLYRDCGEHTVNYRSGYELRVGGKKSQLQAKKSDEFTHGHHSIVNHAAYVSTTMLQSEAYVGPDTRVVGLNTLGLGMVRMWGNLAPGFRAYGGLARLDKHLMPKFRVFHQKGGTRISEVQSENRIAGTHLRAWYIFGPRNKKPGYVQRMMAKEPEVMQKKEAALGGGASAGNGAAGARPNAPLPQVALESRAAYESSSPAVQEANRIVGDLSQELAAGGSKIITPDGLVDGVSPQTLVNKILQVASSGNHSDDVAIALIHNAKRISLEVIDDLTAQASNYASSFNVAEGSSSRAAGSIISTVQQAVEWSDDISARLFDFSADAVQNSFDGATWIADLTDETAASVRAARSAITNLAEVSKAATGRGINLTSASGTYPSLFSEGLLNPLDDLTGLVSGLDDVASSVDDLAQGIGSVDDLAQGIGSVDDLAQSIGSADDLASSVDDLAQGAGSLDDLSSGGYQQLGAANAIDDGSGLADRLLSLNAVDDGLVDNNAYRSTAEVFNRPLSALDVADDSSRFAADQGYSQLNHGALRTDTYARLDHVGVLDVADDSSRFAADQGYSQLNHGALRTDTYARLDHAAVVPTGSGESYSALGTPGNPGGFYSNILPTQSGSSAPAEGYSVLFPAQPTSGGGGIHASLSAPVEYSNPYSSILSAPFEYGSPSASLADVLPPGLAEVASDGVAFLETGEQVGQVVPGMDELASQIAGAAHDRASRMAFGGSYLGNDLASEFAGRSLRDAGIISVGEVAQQPDIGSLGRSVAGTIGARLPIVPDWLVRGFTFAPRIFG